jgi:hypothetical protein
MKFKRWRQNAVDRGEWASVIKDAKALKSVVVPGGGGVRKYDST